MADSVPARLPVGPDSIEELLRVPEGLLPGQYAVTCETKIRASGRSEDFSCYPDSSVPERLRKAVTEAGTHARFIPATRNGHQVDVLMVFRTLVYIGHGGPLVLATPNDGTDQDLYGLLYSSPQFILSSRPREPINNDFFRALNPGIPVWRTFEVDVAGRVTRQELREAAKRSRVLVRALQSEVDRMRFIPGYDGDAPVPASYVEAVYDGG